MLLCSRELTCWLLVMGMPGTRLGVVVAHIWAAEEALVQHFLAYLPYVTGYTTRHWLSEGSVILISNLLLFFRSGRGLGECVILDQGGSSVGGHVVHIHTLASSVDFLFLSLHSFGSVRGGDPWVVKSNRINCWVSSVSLSGTGFHLQGFWAFPSYTNSLNGGYVGSGSTGVEGVTRCICSCTVTNMRLLSGLNVVDGPISQTC